MQKIKVADFLIWHLYFGTLPLTSNSDSHTEQHSVLLANHNLLTIPGKGHMIYVHIQAISNNSVINSCIQVLVET